MQWLILRRNDLHFQSWFSDNYYLSGYRIPTPLHCVKGARPSITLLKGEQVVHDHSELRSTFQLKLV